MGLIWSILGSNNRVNNGQEECQAHIVFDRG